MIDALWIPTSIIGKYKDDIYFMLDTNSTYIGEVVSRMLNVESLGYEIIEEKIEGYAKIILKYGKDDEFYTIKT